MAKENSEGFEQRSESGLISPGMLVIIIVFFLTVIGWGGLFYYNRDLTSKIQDLSQNNDDYAKKDMMEGETQKVVDFKLRLDQAKELLSQGQNLYANFDVISNSILPTVFLKSYEFDEKENTIKLDCYTDNFNSVALQVFSLKEKNFFSDVRLDNALMEEATSRIRFNIILKL